MKRINLHKIKPGAILRIQTIENFYKRPPIFVKIRSLWICPDSACSNECNELNVRYRIVWKVNMGRDVDRIFIADPNNLEERCFSCFDSIRRATKREIKKLKIEVGLASL